MVLIPCFYLMVPATTVDTDGIRVKISALTPAVLTEGFCGLPQSLQANIRGDRLTENYVTTSSFHIISISLSQFIIRRHIAI